MKILYIIKKIIYCATDILHIRDVLHGNRNTMLVHILREKNMCTDDVPICIWYILSNDAMNLFLQKKNVC